VQEDLSSSCKDGSDFFLTSPCPRGGRRAPKEHGGRGATLAHSSPRQSEQHIPILSIPTKGTSATEGTDLARHRAHVCHPDDGSVSDGRNGPRTGSRTRTRFRFPKIAQRSFEVSLDAATQNRNRRRSRAAVRDPSCRSRCSLCQDDRKERFRPEVGCCALFASARALHVLECRLLPRSLDRRLRCR